MQVLYLDKLIYDKLFLILPAAALMLAEIGMTIRN